MICLPPYPYPGMPQLGQAKALPSRTQDTEVEVLEECLLGPDSKVSWVGHPLRTEQCH